MSKHTAAQVEDMIATENDEVVRAMLREYADLLAKKWVGLTDEEIGGLTVFDGLHHIETPLLAEYVLHIQVKLREKNGG
jgi:hypothetical protein